MIECEDYIEKFEEQIKIKYPDMYKSAWYFYKIIQNIEYTTPLEARKALIKTFNMYDEFFFKKPLKLTRKIIVEFIPSEHELSLYVSQVFNICKNYRVYIFLYTKSENQLSFIFELNSDDCDIEAEIQKISDMVVSDLFTSTNMRCITHK